MASFSASEYNTKTLFLSCLTFSALFVTLLALFCQVISLRAEVEALRDAVRDQCSRNPHNDEFSQKLHDNTQEEAESDTGDDDDNEEEDAKFLREINQYFTKASDSGSKIGNSQGDGNLLSMLSNSVGKHKIRTPRGTRKRDKQTDKTTDKIEKRKAKPKKGKRHVSHDVVQFSSSAGPVHPKGIIDDWHYATWVSRGMRKKFSLGRSKPDLGKIKLKSSGVYLAIAQISYTGMSDREFKIIKENSKTKETETIACCIQAMRLRKVHNDTSAMSSCHTSALMFVGKDDQVYVNETITGSGATFETGYSFLAFVRL